MVTSSHNAPKEIGIEGFASHNYIEVFTEEYKRINTSKQDMYSIESELFVKRAVAPYATRQQLVVGDVYLMQLAHIYGRKDQWWIWFPCTYLYGIDEYRSEWRKCVSLAHCKKIMPAFGVKTIEEFRQVLASHPVEVRGFPAAFDKAVGILKIVALSEIASVP